jgi:hypothetical protein
MYIIINRNIEPYNVCTQYIYIYIEREREREVEFDVLMHHLTVIMK